MKVQSSPLFTIACLSVILGLSAGCATKKPVDAPSAENQVNDPAGPAEATIDAEVADVGAVRSVIYFDFDSSDIREDFKGELQRVVAELVAEPNRTARLEGHADSRGSREYNIGLGERRAQAVRQFLTLNGVPQPQLATISYGEERPAATGDDEQAWSKNRRVEIVRLK